MSEEIGGRLLLEISDGVAHLRLNRREKLNALDPPMFDALLTAAARLAVEPEVGAVVLSATGSAFCAGLDLKAVRAEPSAVGHLLGGRDDDGANRVQQAALAWRRLPMPVICALHGAVFGGGLQIALGCDLRIAAPETQLSFMEIKWGLVPDMGGVAMLRGLVRDDLARDLIWTGRVVGGDEALALGLVTRLADYPRTAAIEAARQIAAQPPQAIRAAKRLLNLAADADTRTILAAEADAQASLVANLLAP